MRATCTTLLATAFGALGLVVGSASAHLEGEFTRFQQCPRTNPEVKKCFYSLSNEGEVAIGETKMPIVNPITIQGGMTGPVEDFSRLVGAVNGITFSRTSQPLPGGLSAVVSSGKTPALVEALAKFLSANGLNQVNSTLELARPASEIQLSESNLTNAEGVVMKLPVKIHLENPLLGNSCYIGSSASPVVFELTAGTTNPPPPNLPISGSLGAIELLEGGRVVRDEGAELVDNAWSLPKASGCGGVLSFLITPAINAQLGLPSAAGHNSAILKSTSWVANAGAVRKNDEANP